MAQQIINLLKNKPLSKAEIARALSKQKPTRYLNELMKKLLVAGLVAYTLPDKPNEISADYKGNNKMITDQEENEPRRFTHC